MINYEHIKAGIAVIKEFRKELTVLCKRYQKKLDKACPENIGKIISGLTDNITWIQLTDNFPKEQFSEKELVTNGFEFDRDYEDSVFYSRKIDGIDVYACVHRKDGKT